jgi:hypothetical protein
LEPSKESIPFAPKAHTPFLFYHDSYSYLNSRLHDLNLVLWGQRAPVREHAERLEGHLNLYLLEAILKLKLLKVKRRRTCAAKC